MFEQYFKINWIIRKEHSFILGFFYTILGIISARLIFPENIGLMSIAFTSILLIPSLANLLKIEENVEIREKKFHLIQIFKDHKDIFKVYTFLFLGIFSAYSLITLFIPSASLLKMFAPQLKTAGITGLATGSGLLFNIIKNNLLVFFVCFVLSIVYGAGSILFLVWNASVWGVVFVFIIKKATELTQANIVINFITKIVPFLPHMITEALAYISAAIVGGVISKAVLRERYGTKQFKHIITDAVIFLVIGILLVLIAGIIEVNYYVGF